MDKLCKDEHEVRIAELVIESERYIRHFILFYEINMHMFHACYVHHVMTLSSPISLNIKNDNFLLSQIVFKLVTRHEKGD